MTKRKPASLTRKICKGNVDYAVRQILERNPGITESDSLPIFKSMALKDDDLLEACLFWCLAAARNRANDVDALTPEEKRERELERRRARAERVAEMYERGKALLILNHVMPNGRPVRDCTLGYIRKEVRDGHVGKVNDEFERLCAMDHPDDAIVGDVLSDDAAVGRRADLSPLLAPTDDEARAWCERTT
jgi:hypothetical protein